MNACTANVGRQEDVSINKIFLSKANTERFLGEKCGKSIIIICTLVLCIQGFSANVADGNGGLTF